MKLGDDATYTITIMSYISFCIPSKDVLGLNDVLYVIGLAKNLLSISAMTDLMCVVEFDNKQAS